MDIVIDPETYKKSKIPNAVIAKVAGIMQNDPNIKCPGAKKKWTQTVNMNGERFLVMCHESFGKTVITNMRYVKKRRVRVR